MRYSKTARQRYRPNTATTLALICGLASASSVQAQFDPQKAYQEDPAVAARYPDPAGEYKTPAFAAGKQDFTLHAEMMAFLRDLDQRATTMRVRVLGRSQEGRDIPAALLSRSGDDTDFKDSNRPTVLLIGLQHGDEPAGGEAMLAIAQKLVEGEIVGLLDKINVVIVPRANPDGAEAFQRVTKNGVDVNRDHTLQRTPEGQVLGLAFREYAPHVVFDAHEFTVAGRWVTAFGGLQRPDALIQHATTGNLSPDLMSLQETLIRQPMVKALDAQGLMHDWYYTTAATGQSKTVSMGGIGADTGRNVAALRNAVSFLMETRGVGMGRQHLKRRVHTHVVAIEAAMRSSAENAGELIAKTNAIAQAVAATSPGSPLTIRSAQTSEKRELLFVDPKTGADFPVEADWRSSLTIKPVETRTRPAAYILPPSEAEAARRLRDLGVQVVTTAAPVKLKAEVYKVVSIKEEAKADIRGADTGAGDIIVGEFATEGAEADVPTGSYIVRLDQPLAHLAATVIRARQRCRVRCQSRHCHSRQSRPADLAGARSQ